MVSSFLGHIPFTLALALESKAHARVLNGGAPEILAFTTGPVITLGVRGSDEDFNLPRAEMLARGFEIRRLDRGGQATLHNPGQLVIFPIVNVQALGARAWVALLLKVTENTLREIGKETHCVVGQPGLFSESGKVVAVGIRVRQGISTHGLSINVSNDLSAFESIRPCGVSGAPVDRLGSSFELAEVFATWLRNFKLGLTFERNLTNLECSSSDVRL